jgi:hypothetical protein
MKFQSFILCIELILAAPHSEQFKSRKCPNPQDIQSDYVKQHFDMEKFAPTNGSKFYYEIAKKDITQPRFCKCVTAEKSFDPVGQQVIDAFTIECFGTVNYSDLRFNVTETPGVFVGIWNQKGLPILSKLKFPDTVVDVGLNADGSYDWVIEFQCIETFGVVAFYAFNFYSTTNSMEFFEPMKESFLKAGLGEFCDFGPDLHVIDHTGCSYDKERKQ